MHSCVRSLSSLPPAHFTGSRSHYHTSLRDRRVSPILIERRTHPSRIQDADFAESHHVASTDPSITRVSTQALNWHAVRTCHCTCTMHRHTCTRQVRKPCTSLNSMHPHCIFSWPHPPVGICLSGGRGAGPRERQDPVPSPRGGGEVPRLRYAEATHSRASPGPREEPTGQGTLPREGRVTPGERLPCRGLEWQHGAAQSRLPNTNTNTNSNPNSNPTLPYPTLP